jgi:hypothetical protein
MAVLARAGLGLNFKLRALAEGVASLTTEVDLEIKRTTAPPPKTSEPPKATEPPKTSEPPKTTEPPRDS